MKIFLAGKVTGPSGDWRDKLVPGLKNLGVEEYPAIETMPMGRHTYTGCFPATVPKDEIDAAVRDKSLMPRSFVFSKDVTGIVLCDLFVAYLGEDFHESPATLVEIGFAAALKKCIVLLKKPGIDFNKEYWFALEAAGPLQLETQDPVLGVRTLVDYIEKLQAIHPNIKDIRELLNKPLKAANEEESLNEFRKT